MSVRIEGVMNEIAKNDAFYQETKQCAGEYSDKLDALQLPKKAKLLIDMPANISLTDRVMGSLPTSLGFPTARSCS